MTNKIYKFTNDSYWSSNGCSCCDADYFTCYNSDDIDWRLGSSYNHEDCYVKAIFTNLGIDSLTDDDEESYYCMSLTGLKRICGEMGITVEIEGDDCCEG